MADVDDSWEKFLHPETLKGNLVIIGLFISAFEIFREAVVSKPKTFFSNGFDEDGLILDDKYKEEVLSKSKRKLTASLLWFQEMGAITGDDIEAYHSIRKHRNDVTHEIVRFVSDADSNFDPEMFQRLFALLDKIEKWWFQNFEMAINPEIYPDSVDVDEVVAGPVWSLQLMLDIALGNEPEEGYYYEQYHKHT
ncbi:hypothetical protein [Thiohalobacter thiocyanaticus]|uniref:Uncharacterized protein n=1 Tax=Thiohalobacter thiocyanaticus TaxID=585455 RepID=A0A426QKD7_9GAMM|nr:hypothetical protein [Thiohalobacter thiocyanaticus]RRQ22225.1 hypothetical protein D6C00_09855 [Thiohalobacter thiocyanaticus]